MSLLRLPVESCTTAPPSVRKHTPEDALLLLFFPTLPVTSFSAKVQQSALPDHNGSVHGQIDASSAAACPEVTTQNPAGLFAVDVVKRLSIPAANT